MRRVALVRCIAAFGGVDCTESALLQTGESDLALASPRRTGRLQSVRSLGECEVTSQFPISRLGCDYEREFPVLTAATASISDKDAKQRGQSPKAIKHTNGKLRGRGVRRAPQVQHVGTKAVDEPAVKFEGDAQLVIQDASEGAIKGDSEAVIQAKGQTELTKGESEGHAEAGIKAEGHAELAKGESEGHAEASIKAKGHAELAKGESEGHAKAATKAEGHAKVAVKSDKAAPARNVPDLASELNGQDFFVGSILVQIYQPFQYPPTLQLFVGASRVGNRVSHYFARPQDVFGHGDIIAGEAQHFDMQGLWMVRSVREAPCILRRVHMFPEPQFYSW
ncbi:hypothetical protein TRIUR3_33922 [Triticum urartu]|uniref:Uncharacterized protein n=1 Tax=Triticum urartu TaxID=4572 RepID=M7YTM9_TRIUA|nr:hypothetical protein TRIUR3_33922 [Triticum urartu]